MVKKMISKKSKKYKKQIGGSDDVVGATINLINSMIDLGKSIFGEIDTLTHMGDDINKASAPSSGTPGQIEGPKEFKAPELKNH